MPRSGAAARERLERAALELYTERGYSHSTTAQIAARARVTERTFFRHFADKREVLFNIEARLNEALIPALADVPADMPPPAAVLQAFRRMVADLEDNRALAESRHRVIAATPALRERQLAKETAMSALVADALRARGLPEGRATLLAQVCTAALTHAVHRWVTDPSGDLDALLVQAFVDLHDFFGVETTQGRQTQTGAPPAR